MPVWSRRAKRYRLGSSASACRSSLRRSRSWESVNAGPVLRRRGAGPRGGSCRNGARSARATLTTLALGRRIATVAVVTELSESPLPDSDREAVVARLTEHAGAGHLTLAQFDERARRAYAAASRDELTAVTSDLPSSTTPVRARRRARRWVVALLGGSTLTGRWRLSGTLTSVSVMGGSTLDLRDVELDGAEVTITTLALMGGDDIYVPDGVEVEMTGFALMGGNDEHGATTSMHPGAPVVRIRAFAVMGGVDLWRVPAGSDTGSLKHARARVKHLGRGHG